MNGKLNERARWTDTKRCHKQADRPKNGADASESI